jgi:hypothetical protein
MEVLHPRCCGLDVHKATVVACVRLVIDGKAVKETRTFATTTASLLAAFSHTTFARWNNLGEWFFCIVIERATPWRQKTR